MKMKIAKEGHKMVSTRGGRSYMEWRDSAYSDFLPKHFLTRLRSARSSNLMMIVRSEEEIWEILKRNTVYEAV